MILMVVPGCVWKNQVGGEEAAEKPFREAIRYA
jgi:hypothetical protein